jgi:hypothetical protein
MSWRRQLTTDLVLPGFNLIFIGRSRQFLSARRADDFCLCSASLQPGRCTTEKAGELQLGKAVICTVVWTAVIS